MDHSIRKLHTPVKDAPDYRAILEPVRTLRSPLERITPFGFGCRIVPVIEESKPLCQVRGRLYKGAMCGSIIVGGKFCGATYDCEHKG